MFWGARSSLNFECFWKTSRHPDKKLTQHRKMSWTVFGGARPAVHLNVVECVHNIKTKRCLTPRIKLGRDKGCWEAAPPSTWMSLKWLHNIHTKSFFNRVKGTWPCLEKHGLAIQLNVFKKFHINRTKNCFNTVKWAGPCLGEHDQPFIWTLLKVCITSKRHLCLTPWNELGRDRGCWGARPSHYLERLWNGCITFRPKAFVTPWIDMGRVWGSTTQPKFWRFLKCFMPSGRKVDSTPWNELDRV